MKKCNRCKALKDEKEFTFNKRSKDGLTSYCRSCNADVAREYHLKHVRGNTCHEKCQRCSVCFFGKEFNYSPIEYQGKNYCEDCIKILKNNK